MFLLLIAAFTCPPDQVLSVELPSWKKGLLAAAAGSEEQHAALAALRFAVVPGNRGPHAECAQKPAVEGVDVFDAGLTDRGDKLVQVRLRACKGTKDEWQSLRIAALVPLGDGKHCKLDAEDLSFDRAAANRPCDNAAKLPRTLSFMELVEKGRKVVLARDQEGFCSQEGQSSAGRLTIFEAQGWSLRKIFETDTLDSSPQAQGRQLVQRWSVAFGKALPKAIRVQRCIEGGECDPAQDFVYAPGGGKYVPK